MSDNDLRYVGISASWSSICVVGLAMLRLAGREANFGVILFILWGISPYGALMAGDFLIRKITINSKITKSFCVASVLSLIFTAYVCLEAISSRSSTAGLVFIFLPFYLNVIVAFLVTSGLIWATFSKPSKK